AIALITRLLGSGGQQKEIPADTQRSQRWWVGAGKARFDQMPGWDRHASADLSRGGPQYHRGDRNSAAQPRKESGGGSRAHGAFCISIGRGSGLPHEDRSTDGSGQLFLSGHHLLFL